MSGQNESNGSNKKHVNERDIALSAFRSTENRIYSYKDKVDASYVGASLLELEKKTSWYVENCKQIVSLSFFVC